MDRTRLWPIAGLTVVSHAAACGGNARFAFDKKSLGTRGFENVCDVNDRMPIVREVSGALPLLNVDSTSRHASVPMPNPCLPA